MENRNHSKLKMTALTGAAVLVLGLSVTLFPRSSGAEKSRSLTETAAEAQEADLAETPAYTAPEPPEKEILVYVCGEVSAPDVYRLPEGARAADAVRMAGGFTENASETSVNLAEKLSDGEMIRIPDRESGEREKTGDGRINLNTAGPETLQTLPGIGESRAEDIIRYRETHGPFQKCEDVMKVPGIKEKAYEKLKDRIAV